MNESLMQQILDELRALKLGQQELHSGQQQLQTGYQELRGGIQQLQTGYQELRGGIQQLQAGYQELRDGQQQLQAGQEHLSSRVAYIEKNMATKQDVADLPYIKRALMETLEITKEISEQFASTKAEVNTHSYTIEILNRRQLHMEADIEKLKNR